MDKISDEQLMEALSERYLALLEKDFHYQMGDDDYQLTTEEHKILTSVRTILKDIKSKNEKAST
jgi:hypothetical protein